MGDCLLDAYPCEWNLELIEYIIENAEKRGK